MLMLIVKDSSSKFCDLLLETEVRSVVVVNITGDNSAYTVQSSVHQVLNIYRVGMNL